MKYQSELERIKKFYSGDSWSNKNNPMYSFFANHNLYHYQSRDRALINIFKKHGLNDLSNIKILEVGCGRGLELNNLIRFGAQPKNLYGIDLMNYRITDATLNNKSISFFCCDASQMPFMSESFDVVIQIMAFTSILDDGLKKMIAKEMMRLTNKNGLIIWIDYFITNPFKKGFRDVKPIRKKEIHDLFSSMEIKLNKRILIRPILIFLSKISYLLCFVAENLLIFNSFYIGSIKHKK